MPPKAYSYKRFSSANQNAGSIERQEKVLADAARWCAENGIPLDTSLSYVDLKTSAFRGKNKDTGALGDFLKAIERGKVKSGDFLIVEELSRLTRMEINDALELFLSIINRGVKIVSLVDRKVFSRDIEPAQMTMDLLISITMLSASHLESYRKSKRGKEFYKTIRTDLAKGVVKTHLHCPWWLEKKRDKDGNTTFDVIEERAALVREVFRLAAEGKGPVLIAQALPRAMTALLPGKDLARYFQYLVQQKSVIGYYQPKERVYDGAKAGRQAVGDEVRIYPAVVSEDAFYKVQDLRAIRHRNNDFKLERIANIFGNLCKCCYCGSTLRLSRSADNTKTGKYRNSRKKLNHYLSCPKSIAKQCCFGKASYTLLEPVLLEHVRGLDAEYLVSGKTSTKTQELQDKRAEVETTLGELQGKIANLLKHLEDSPDLNAVVSERLKALTAERELHQDQVAGINLELAQTQRNTATDIHALLKLLGDDPKDDGLRGKIKAELSRLVERIEVRETKLKDQQQHSSKIPVCVRIYYKNGNVQAVVQHEDAKVALEFHPEDAVVPDIRGSKDLDGVAALIRLSAEADLILGNDLEFSPRIEPAPLTS